MTATPPYRVALIGCGRAGLPRARAFDMHPQCRVVALADTDAENLEFARAAFGAPGYDSYDELFANEQIDIAVAVLPVAPNAGAVAAAAEAGCRAVFCEKPLTARLADADWMVEACGSRGVPLVCGVVISSHADYQKAYALAAAGEIGAVRRINLYEGNGQGGCHGLNLARRFAGRGQVDCVIGRVQGDPHSDYEQAHAEGAAEVGAVGGYIRFANGVECYSSWEDIGWRGIEIIGTEGMICNSNNTGLGLRLFKSGARGAGLREVEGVFSEYVEEDRGYDEEGWRDPGSTMKGIVKELVDYLQGGQPPGATSGNDMRHALEIAIALRESQRRGHAAVELPLADRSLAMYPVRARWEYKKEVYGREWYMEQMTMAKKP